MFLVLGLGELVIFSPIKSNNLYADFGEKMNIINIKNWLVFYGLLGIKLGRRDGISFF